MNFFTKYGRALSLSAAVVGMFVWTASAQPPTPGLKFIATGATWRVEVQDKTISGTVVVPATYNGKPVSSIANFYDCPGITGIAIPNSVTTIDGNAFRRNTGITSVTIPASVATVGGGAFNSCNNLSSVTFQGITNLLTQYADLGDPFPGDLTKVYRAGGPGTYTRQPGKSAWTKQDGAAYSQPAYDPTPVPAPAPQQPSGKAIGDGGYDDPEPRRHSRPDRSGNSFVDRRDGREYGTVKIGRQTWMAENLDYQAGNSWCYGNKTSNCEKYGRLYDWNTARTACPAGWHLPSKSEWDELVRTAGGTGAGAKTLRSASGWNYNGTDDYGFSGLPGGERTNGGGFQQAGTFVCWWTGTAVDGGSAQRWFMHGNGSLIGSPFAKNWGYSVRCVSD